MTKFAFEFDNVRTSNVFSRFEIRRIFSCTHCGIRTSGLRDRHHMSTPNGHRNNQLNKCTLPNSLKGLKIILDMADRHTSKDGPFRILGNALTYLLSDFFGITFFHVNIFAFAFAFERISFMKFAFDEHEFFLASSHPYFTVITVSTFLYRCNFVSLDMVAAQVRTCQYCL